MAKQIIEFVEDTSPLGTDLFVKQAAGGGSGSTKSVSLQSVADLVGGLESVLTTDNEATDLDILLINGIYKAKGINPAIWLEQTDAPYQRGASIVHDGPVLQIQRRAVDFGAFEATPVQFDMRADSATLITDENGRTALGDWTPTARFHVFGEGNDSSTFAVKVENSDDDVLFQVRDDAVAGIGRTPDETNFVALDVNGGIRIGDNTDHSPAFPGGHALIDCYVPGGGGLVITNDGNSAGIPVYIMATPNFTSRTRGAALFLYSGENFARGLRLRSEDDATDPNADVTWEGAGTFTVQTDEAGTDLILATTDSGNSATTRVTIKGAQDATEVEIDGDLYLAGSLSIDTSGAVVLNKDQGSTCYFNADDLNIFCHPAGGQAWQASASQLTLNVALHAYDTAQVDTWTGLGTAPASGRRLSIDGDVYLEEGHKLYFDGDAGTPDTYITATTGGSELEFYHQSGEKFWLDSTGASATSRISVNGTTSALMQWRTETGGPNDLKAEARWLDSSSELEIRTAQADSSTIVNRMRIAGEIDETRIGIDAAPVSGYALAVGGATRLEDDLLFVGSGSGLPFAEIYAADVTDTITITGTGIANKVQVTSFATDGESNQATPDHTNDHITIDKAGQYLVTVSVSFSSVGGTAYSVGFGLFKNNGATRYSNVTAERNLAGGGADIGSASLSGIIDADAADTLELWVWNNTNTNNVVIENVTLSIVQIGGGA